MENKREETNSKFSEKRISNRERRCTYELGGVTTVFRAECEAPERNGKNDWTIEIESVKAGETDIRPLLEKHELLDLLRHDLGDMAREELFFDMEEEEREQKNRMREEAHALWSSYRY